jgi:hypothetical protein
MRAALGAKTGWWRPALTGIVAASLLLLALPLCPCPPPSASSAEGHDCCAEGTPSIAPADCCARPADANPAPPAAAATATPSHTALALDVTALPVPRREARPPLAIVVDVSPRVASPPFVLRV